LGQICIEVNRLQRPEGDALCPHCGSSNLTYKNVFGYYKCNKCLHTFITPVYSYGQKQESWDIKEISNLTRQMFGVSKVERQEEKEIEPNVNVKSKRKASGVGWLVTLIIICILAIIVLTLLVFYGDEIQQLIDRLF